MGLSFKNQWKSWLWLGWPWLAWPWPGPGWLQGAGFPEKTIIVFFVFFVFIVFFVFFLYVFPYGKILSWISLPNSRAEPGFGGPGGTGIRFGKEIQERTSSLEPARAQDKQGKSQMTSLV